MSINHSKDQKTQELTLTRRTFVYHAAGATAFLSTACSHLPKPDVVPRETVGGKGMIPPSEKLNLVGIGVGGVGYGQLSRCAENNHVAALCDVDDKYASKAYKKWPQARRYHDFRELFDQETDYDAVYIGTPDHTHALITKAAIEKGKPVCCVKPLTRTIGESRIIAHLAHENQIISQVTASSNTNSRACRVCEWIWGGAIGDVHEVHCWSNRPLWPQGMARPKGEDPVPEHFRWDLWLGPAPQRPFKDKWPDGHLALEQVIRSNVRRDIYHPWNFRGWWDFGTGALGDMGCHHFNTVFRALKLKYPTRVYASSSKSMPEAAPLASCVVWEFPAREGMPPLKAFWYDGGLQPPIPPQWPKEKPWPKEGNMYVGDKGVLLSRGELELLPESRMKRYENYPKTLERKESLWDEWLDACRGSGEQPSCRFEIAGPLTEMMLLGNIAIRTGQQLEWDGPTRKFTNSDEANKLVQEPYHNGWKL